MKRNRHQNRSNRRNLSVERLENRAMFAADLMGVAFAVGTRDVPNGGQLPVEYQVRNAGTSTAGSHSVAFYLSDDATITSADRLLLTRGQASLAAGALRVDTVTLTLPSPDPMRTDNEYFVGMIIDPSNAVGEADEGNNSNRGTGLDRDYVRSEKHLPFGTNGATVAPTALPAGATVSAGIGTDEWIGAYDVDVYHVTATAGQTLGFDVDSPGAFDPYLRLYTLGWSLLAQNDNGAGPLPEDFLTSQTTESYVQHTFASTGNYFLVVSSEENRSSNPRVMNGRSTTSGAADTGTYTITSVNAPSDLAANGVVIGINRPDTLVDPSGQEVAAVALSNEGGLTTPQFDIGLYLSSNNVISTADTLLHTIPGYATNGGGAGFQTASYTVQLGTTDPFRTTNRYYIGGRVDINNEVTESDETNNTAANVISSEADLPSPVTGTSVVARPLAVGAAPVAASLGNDEWIGPYDVDVFRVNAAPRKRLAFDIDLLPPLFGQPQVNTHVRVYDASWNLVASNDNGAAPGEVPSGASYAEHYSEAGGTHYVVVSGAGNASSDPRLLTGRTAASTGSYTLSVADVTPPQVSSTFFSFAGNNPADPHWLRWNFTSNVSASLTTADVRVENLTAGTSISAGSMALTHSGTQSILRFPGLPGATLPDGNYRATLIGAGITDAAGRALDGDADGSAGGDHEFEFFFLRGDANHDRIVNLADFNVLASNFGQSPRTFAQGDFNYDGTVNLGDFNVLASRFGQSLPEPGARGGAGDGPLFGGVAIGDKDAIDELRKLLA
jgi:hypothetical protein